jgi:hypothetical protein
VAPIFGMDMQFSGGIDDLRPDKAAREGPFYSA